MYEFETYLSKDDRELFSYYIIYSKKFCNDVSGLLLK